MAHKAKPTRKTNTTPETKSTPKTKTNSKTKTTEKSKTTQKWNNEVASYAFTEPVIRILSGAAVKRSGLHQKTRPSHRHDADTKGDLTVFYKLERKSDGTDIIGRRGLSTWKKSSGRSKSWANCRRLKLARDDLELLIRSKSRPVAFGWPFSTIITPSSFIRSHGMSCNRQSETKQNGLSRVQPFKDLEEEYDPKWPLPRGRSFKARARRQEMMLPVGVRFFRLTINRGILSLAIEAFPGEISLSTSQLKVAGNENNRSATMLEGLVVLRLLQNESHADVYLVQNRNALSEFYHAHAFLDDGLSGNWSTFSRRKMDRLRRSNGFHAETVQLGRKIIVMEADSKEDKDFRVKSMQREFPPLPGTELKLGKIRPKKIRVSYAAVVGQKLPSKQHLDSNHRAYKAWEDRKGRIKRADTRDSITSHDTKLEEKMEEFTAKVERRTIQNIIPCNRVSILSNIIM